MGRDSATCIYAKSPSTANSPLLNDSQIDSQTMRQAATSGDTPEQTIFASIKRRSAVTDSKEGGKRGQKALFTPAMAVCYTIAVLAGAFPAST
jgi:hypothetical protein